MARKEVPTRKPENVTGATQAAELVKGARMDERVRRRAYDIYSARCHSGACGDALADWIAAEAELKAGRNGHEQAARAGGESGGSET